ncbi:MAG TPA: sigma-54 dependent transcriptional regulator [Syntrophorhabdales bacterium]|nr:sigma-54 dependent transcriptional regulator [Syntrophorhabdales bacterium]
MKTNILVVDDDLHMRLALKESLNKAGYSVSVAEDGLKATEVIKRGSFDLVITDVRMPHKSGIDLLESVRETSSLVPVILITAYGTIQDAVKAIKEGAFDYIQKPFNTETLYGVVKRALGLNRGKIIYGSRAMKDILWNASRVARSDTTVLILGESGVGKELVAKYVHENSERRTGPFIPVNCAALPDTLLESELFGYERGAFTGAMAKKPGKFELADKGTLLLDEISEMELRLQAKLLRVLQEKEIEIIGSRYPKKVDVRVIATTNRDMKKCVEEGKFREDLYYRLNVFPIVVPPLRDRKEDVPILVEYFLAKYSQGKDTSISDDAMEFLKEKTWKGNVRELENTLARACILSDYSVVKLTHLQDLEARKELKVGSVRDMEMNLILDTLRSVNGNRTQAASILGITVRTLRNKIKEYKELGIAVPQGCLNAAN